MERTTRVLVATGVLAVGAFAAWTMRKPVGMPEAAFGAAPQTMMQTASGPQSAAPYFPRDGRVPTRQAPVAHHPAELDFQIEPATEPVPAAAAGWHADTPFTPLSSERTASEQTASERTTALGQSGFEPVATAPQVKKPAPITHQIRDGDTLYTLAEKYLGDGQRQLEIYQENRHLLPSPDLLPIGVVLHMPTEPEYADAAPPTASTAQALVPIPPAAIRRQAAQRP